MIDSHCHIHQRQCAPWVEGWIREATAAGIEGFFLGGISPDEWTLQLEFQKKYPQLKVFTSAGFHPWWVAGQKEVDVAAFTNLEKLLPQFTALGELGLDSLKESMSLQMDVFERQLQLAKKLAKPLVLHVVRQHPEVLKRVAGYRGLVHSFSGNWAQAKKYIDHGFLISISGSFMNHSRPEMDEVIKKTPAESLLIETDAPDQPIPRYRNQPQPPVALLEIAEKIAEFRGQSSKDLLAQSRENLIRVFGC